MASFASLLKQKAAAALSPSTTPAPEQTTLPAAAAQPAAAQPVAASSHFSVPSFSLPGITMPSLGLGLIPMGIDSTKNNNPPPSALIYPTVAGTQNPNYTIPEATLRAAMYFPDTWAAGVTANKKPVILVPGTGAYGGTNFRNNYTKLLIESGFANPMWLNIPGAMCDESGKNAEFVAYAIHYVWLAANQTKQPVQGLTGEAQNQANAAASNKITLIAWSQGNLACQWTLKYWPQTRILANNLISISADFHGTLLAYFPIPNSPSILCQQYTSNFIRTLRSNGGDSAYIPTTSIYSSLLDEIVQPQAGDGASAYMKNGNGVESTNVDLQQACPFTPAGLMYGHAGVLYNAVAWALTKDAMLNGGPGRLDRINLPTVSMQPFAPGLTPADVSFTLGLIPVAGANIIGFLPKYFIEPAIPYYAAAEAAALPPPSPLTPDQQKIVDNSKNQSPYTAQHTVVDPSLAASASLEQSMALGQSAAAPSQLAAQ